LADTAGGTDKQRMKRVETNDPVALIIEGFKNYEKGDYTEAFGHYTKAAKGDGLEAAEAHFKLSSMLYRKGHGVEKDEQKMNIHHLEVAAIGGHAIARLSLGTHELKNGNKEREVKHLIIAATQGEDHSIKALINAFKEGLVSKEVLAATLRAHQAAIDATKTPQRDEAAKYFTMIE